LGSRFLVSGSWFFNAETQNRENIFTPWGTSADRAISPSSRPKFLMLTPQEQAIVNMRVNFALEIERVRKRIAALI